MVQLCGKLEVIVIEARGLPNLDFNPLNKSDKSDPYCTIDIEGVDGRKRIGKTNIIDDELNPKWDFNVRTNIDSDVSGLKFTVKDKDVMTSDIIGGCFLDTLSFLNGGKKYRGFMNLISPKGRSAGSLRIIVQFTGTKGRLESDTGFVDKVGERMSKNNKEIPVTESKYVLLHGILNIYIEKATDLPNLDTSILSIQKSDVSDPYVIIMIQDGRNELWKVGVTSVVDNNLNPVWKENFHINVCHEVKSIKFIIRDKDIISSNEIGVVTILGDDIKRTKLIEGKYSIFTSSGKNTKGNISFSMQYISVDEAKSSSEVPGCTFPMRECNHVILYQDAHGLDTIDGDPRRAWLDIHNTLLGAKEYIYIAGWSFHPNVSLLRFNNEDNTTIGEILIRKANEGVQVCILLWNEATSTDLNKDGLMSTSDEFTADYFKDTLVNCSLAVRKRKNTHFMSTKAKFTFFCYSHHQKLVIADSTTKGFRYPVAFIGGLDLTKGRFDTPEHNLFKRLDTCYQTDFYNNLIDTTQKIGPRQPWHDIHCSINGYVVLDIFYNFRQRWEKQGPKEAIKLIIPQPNRELLSSIQFSWNVQMFRSINSDSVDFSELKEARGIFVKKGRLFDNSIHRAYIHNIRRSKKFIYIENQYFMGSSHAWLKDKNAGISNLIPVEIVTHIEEKIRHRERFIAYILIPMFPEGHPSNGEIKEIMYWQYRTIEMMYRRIALALQEVGSTDHPQDYLLFFALAKREGGYFPKVPEGLQGFAANAFRNQRLMIYVHSKLAIFDDEYIMIGSANINDRSLSGNRDTEIVIGAYQPNYMCNSTLPLGDVSKFRKSLWLEHIGVKAPINQDPSNPYCIKKMKQLAEEGLGSYISVNSYKGIRHLIIYPLKVHLDGTVTVRPDCPTIPDTNIHFIGCRSKLIPTKLTS